MELDGPFVVSKVSTGHMTYPGFEHVKWEGIIVKMERERLFSFTWPYPKSFDREMYSGDYSEDPRTLVEFRLEKTKDGTLLMLTESGFDKLPGDLRIEAFRRNEGGCTQQMRNIEAYDAKAEK